MKYFIFMYYNDYARQEIALTLNSRTDEVASRRIL